MLKIDSVKLELPPYAIRIKNEEPFYIKANQQTNHLEYRTNYKSLTCFLGRERTLGLNEVYISQDKSIIKISAKILNEKYHELINKNNISRVIENINSIGIIEIDESEFLENSHILSVDITKDLLVPEDKKEIFNLVQILTHDKKYYSGEKTAYCSFNSKNKRRGERVIIYDKYKELLRKNNAELIQKINIERFKNILRVEAQLSRSTAIKKHLAFCMTKDNKLPLNRLLDVSHLRIIAILNKIIPVKVNKQLFSNVTREDEKCKPMEYIKNLGVQNLLGKFDNNAESLLRYLKVKFGVRGNYYRNLILSNSISEMTKGGNYSEEINWFFHQLLMSK